MSFILPGMLGVTRKPIVVPPSYATTRTIDLDGDSGFLTQTSTFDPDTVIGTGDFSVSMQFRADDVGVDQYLLYWGDNTASYTNWFRTRIIGSTNKVEISFSANDSNGASVSSTSTISADTGYQIIVTRSGTTAKLYINGTLEATLTDANVATTFGADVVNYGKPIYGTSGNFYGLLDQILCWDVELSSDAVDDFYNSGSTFDYSQNYENYQASGDLLFWLKLDETTGTSAADATGNGYTGTINSGVSWSTALCFDATPSWANTYSFGELDGSTDYATTPIKPHDLNLDTAFSIALWARPSSLSATMRFFGRYDDPNQRFWLGLNTTNFDFAIGDTLNNSLSHGMSVNTWYHVVLTWDGADAKIYKNATLVGTISSTITWTSVTDIYLPTIGALNNKGTIQNFFHGFLDELCVFNAALDADAVTALYNSRTPFDPRNDSGNYDNSSNLQAYFHIKNSTPYKIIDSTYNGNTGDTSATDLFSTTIPS